MQKYLFSSHWILVVIVVVVLAACSPAATPVAEPTNLPQTNTPEPQAPTNTPEESVAQAATDTEGEDPTTAPVDAPTNTPVAVASDGSDGRVLAWVAPAAAPGRQAADAAGEVVYFTPDGAMETVMTLPDSTTRVTACGNASTSPDGSIFAFMTTVTAGGGEHANLHLIRGVSTNVETIAEDLNPIACVGSSSFHFSPDGSRFGFIDWPDSANNATSPIGRLLIYDANSAEQVANIENVTDFTLTASGATFASFFLNSDNDATEVGIFLWDGENDREVSTLRAEEGCAYTSASITPVAGERLAVILGYRCTGSGTQWQLHMVDTNNNTAQLEISEAAAGRYFGFSDTNAIWASPNGETLWFTVPDGVSNQTVSLLNTSVDSLTPTTVIERFAVMPTISDLPYDANNATAHLSPNGQYLAIVRNDGNDDAVLHVVNLAEPTLDPVQVDAGDRGDTIGALAFSQDSSTLVFVAGTDEGGNNALLTMDLATGNESRIARGRFAQVAIAPDASQIAAMNWEVFDADEDPYLRLVIVDAESSAETVIFEGGEVNDEGNLINQAFAYPLSWRTP